MKFLPAEFFAMCVGIGSLMTAMCHRSPTFQQHLSTYIVSVITITTFLLVGRIYQESKHR